MQRINRWVGVGGAKSIVDCYVKQHANAWLWDAAIRVLDEPLVEARQPTSAQSGQWNLKHWNTKKTNSQCGVSVVSIFMTEVFLWDFMISWQLIVQHVVYSQHHMFKQRTVVWADCVSSGIVVLWSLITHDVCDIFWGWYHHRRHWLEQLEGAQCRCQPQSPAVIPVSVLFLLLSSLEPAKTFIVEYWHIMLLSPAMNVTLFMDLRCHAGGNDMNIVFATGCSAHLSTMPFLMPLALTLEPWSYGPPFTDAYINGFSLSYWLRKLVSEADSCKQFDVMYGFSMIVSVMAQHQSGCTCNCVTCTKLTLFCTQMQMIMHGSGIKDSVKQIMSQCSDALNWT